MAPNLVPRAYFLAGKRHWERGWIDQKVSFNLVEKDQLCAIALNYEQKMNF